MHKITNTDWADVLIQVLPYIKQYAGKTVVVKYGGNAMLNAELKQAVMEDLVLMSCVGIRTILVHGGGPEIDAALQKMGKKSVFINGLRYTDAETMDIVQQVLAGKINKEIVSLVQHAGGNAIGLCGIDGGMLRAKKLENAVDLGFVGEITAVNTSIIEFALSNNIIPIISTIAAGEKKSQVYNINADTAAAKIAVALNAEKFVQMTNVPGLLRDVHNPESLISEIKREDIPNLIHENTISQGMIPKVECCVEALEGGVSRTYIIDGRIPHALIIEIFSHRGVGTMIV